MKPIVVLGPSWAVARWKSEHPENRRPVAQFGYPLMGYRLADEDVVLLDGWQLERDRLPHAGDWVRGSLALKFGPADYELVRARLELPCE